MKTVEIYTDGACLGNPGPGGWCAILIYKGVEKTISGLNKETTNNRMELAAAIEGLKALKEKCKVILYSDSAYLVNSINENWIENWQKNNFKKIKNVDLWKELIYQIKIHNVRFIKVKGHSDNKYNNKCDLIAREQAKQASN
ncbi:MAG: ribonuclease HI [Christensenellales bacterium]|jgi:ribonuclease HI|nr:ribonuclease HI [Clostridiales bacterium]